MNQKIAVQIDFDGTVTIEDVSFLLLDAYAGCDWRKHLDAYSSGAITVGAFNKKVFSLVKAGRKTMTDFVLTSPRVKIRPGFKELVEYCKNRGFKTVIVSNGLKFYIEELLKVFGIKGLEIHASETKFSKGGMKVVYIGPDGKEVDAGFKEAYARNLRKQGYDIIYIGDGTSDFFPARLARVVFAREELLKTCAKENLKHYAFKDFFEVIEILKRMDKE